jgi:hypothetical protein
MPCDGLHRGAEDRGHVRCRFRAVNEIANVPLGGQPQEYANAFAAREIQQRSRRRDPGHVNAIDPGGPEHREVALRERKEIRLAGASRHSRQRIGRSLDVQLVAPDKEEFAANARTQAGTSDRAGGMPLAEESSIGRDSEWVHKRQKSKACCCGVAEARQF